MLILGGLDRQANDALLELWLIDFQITVSDAEGTGLFQTMVKTEPREIRVRTETGGSFTCFVSVCGSA